MYERTSSYRLEPSYTAKAQKLCLLIEGHIPRLDLELILKNQLGYEVKRLFLSSDSAEILDFPLGTHYDLIMLNNVPPQRLYGLGAQPALETLVIALVDNQAPLDTHAWPVHYYLPINIAAWQFEVCVKQLLKQQIISSHYLWLKMNESQEQPLQLLHQSEGTVLFKRITSPAKAEISSADS